MKSLKNLGCLLSLFTSLFAGTYAASAGAVTLEMSAVFRPDPANPMRNTFENTTPQGGHCKEHPNYCAPGVFSIGVPTRFRAVAPIEAKHDQRQGPMFRLPSSWKEVTVIHDETGEPEIVKMRISGLGAAYTLKEPLVPAHWSPHWGYPDPPCVSGGTSYGTAHYFAFFWRVPADGGVCSKQAQLPITLDYGFAYENFSFSYELQTPNPLQMSTGTYRGVLNYVVGPHGDIDMGDIMLPDDDLISLNFTLSVEHTLKVEIPPGGDRVELVPQGGWQAWLTQGRKPTRLFRDQTFNISSSSRFKMTLACQYYGNSETCGVSRAGSLRTFPVNLSVTLPNGLVDAAGSPVVRRPLRRDGSGTELFLPGFYIDRKPGTLHFEIAQDQVNEMLVPGEATTYSGRFTVIWDSEVG
ncbi:hypothetical protein [Pseudomonas sp.]|uniref:hypothetical protein n=1 Tax=Pseudomonas sp. TaxID=306 RepID=UPI003F2DA9CB